MDTDGPFVGRVSRRRNPPQDGGLRFANPPYTRRYQGPVQKPTAPVSGGRGVDQSISTVSREALSHRFGPSLLDPIGGGSGFVVALAGLRPVRRRGDVADWNGDGPFGIPDRERVFGNILAEPGDRVLVALVIVGPDVEIARRGIHSETFQLADDGFVFRPTAGQLVGAFDCEL